MQSLNLSAEELELAKGRKAAEVIASLFRETLSQQEIERLTRERQILRRERLASTDIVRPIPGSNEFLLVLGKSGVKRILATDAPAANVEAIFS